MNKMRLVHRVLRVLDKAQDVLSHWTRALEFEQDRLAWKKYEGTG